MLRVIHAEVSLGLELRISVCHLVLNLSLGN